MNGWEFVDGGTLTVTFQITEVRDGDRVGVGGWFLASPDSQVSVLGLDGIKFTLTEPALPNWSKFGTQWVVTDSRPVNVTLRFECGAGGFVSIWGMEAGSVRHVYYDVDRVELDPERHAKLLATEHTIAPEANFIAEDGFGEVLVESEGAEFGVRGPVPIALKSCNRCARFLPINLHDERSHLSFSNHCVAEHRRPCSHAGFGRLRDVEEDELVQLDYGFQLECRFCKKWEVNAALNPQRTAAQMKEDGARRRALELLLTELYGGSPSLLYREAHGGSELTDDVFERFERSCFKCGIEFVSPRDMHLDHTRPLALLWPLDDTATSLCETHNSAKRDRAPVDFYAKEELERLSSLTGIGMRELLDPSPNREAIDRLAARLDWFFDEFLQADWLQEERDGKVAADLLVKAIQKAINRLPDDERWEPSLADRYVEWRSDE